jgi:hypothetical protein
MHIYTKSVRAAVGIPCRSWVNFVITCTVIVAVFSYIYIFELIGIYIILLCVIMVVAARVEIL